MREGVREGQSKVRVNSSVTSSYVESFHLVRQWV